MKDNASSMQKQSLRDQLNGVGKVLLSYAVVWFALLLVGVYGFVAYRVVTARSAEPTEADISAKVDAAPTLHVDPNAVSQLQSLQDNSVNVKTLFDQARSNPFQE